jgi:uncharacterized protein (TIGR04255 family)
MAVLPVFLEKDTIVECVFEMRFSASHQSVAELLPGLIYGKLGKIFDKGVNTLPLGLVPKPVRDANPALKYVPTHVLEGSDIRMMFGPYTTAVSFPRPYPGWAKVKPLILECMQTVLGTGLFSNPERVGLKYVNVLQEGRDEFDLGQTRVTVALADFPLRAEGASVRGEIERNGCITVVEVSGGLKISPGAGKAELLGVQLTVDTIRPVKGTDLKNDLPSVLETLHDTEKGIYFGLLSDATLKKLGPRYKTTH